ncbi:hypothetical protein [Streptomyces sp. GS7]|uniref:hypothetical protein n=1 Tax=Streptomyces sp. GS7 TaxID=2692234 RepID=UPI001316995B|nr:hypothetical protein [Streptomyces sp. GS7]QHC26371.1 hypothetical protein GR130_38410 [Streptomyces sp. GS7]
MSNSSNPKRPETQTSRRRAMGIKARDARRTLAAERRDFRQRHGDPAHWGSYECDLYLGLGGI